MGGLRRANVTLSNPPSTCVPPRLSTRAVVVGVDSIRGPQAVAAYPGQLKAPFPRRKLILNAFDCIVPSHVVPGTWTGEKQGHRFDTIEYWQVSWAVYAALFGARRSQLADSSARSGSSADSSTSAASSDSTGSRIQESAKLLERGKFHGIFIADSYGFHVSSFVLAF